MTSAPPTLVLVHGAWHGSWAWDRLVAQLDGVTIRRVDLPSVGADPALLGDMYADAALIRETVTSVDGPVVICAHSYGGIPTSEGAADLPNLVGLVYLCAFQLDVGESVATAMNGPPPEWQDLHPDQGYVDALRPEQIFYADVDPDIATGAIAQLTHHGLGAMMQPQTRAAWRTVPSTYIVCEHDQAIPVAAQDAMSQRAAKKLRLPTSHSPFLAAPRRLADLLRAELAGAGI